MFSPPIRVTKVSPVVTAEKGVDHDGWSKNMFHSFTSFGLETGVFEISNTLNVKSPEYPVNGINGFELTTTSLYIDK